MLNALASGAAQGLADSVSDAVKSAYGKLKQLVNAKLSGNNAAEVALAEHATDPETWQAPLAKALTASGAGADQAIIGAARQLMALLDPAGTEQGKYQVDLPGAQGVQVGDGNQQFNTFNTVTPTIMMAPPPAEIQLGQPRNEPAFGAAFQAAEGAHASAGHWMRPTRTALAGCSTSTARAAASGRSSARSRSTKR